MAENKIFSDKYFIIILTLCFVSASIEANICFPILSEMSKQLKLGEQASQMMMSVNFVALGLIGLFIGYVSDYFSPFKLLRFGMLMLSLSSLGCFFSHHMYSMLIFRFLQGFSAAFPIVICSSLIPKLYPVEKSAKLLNFSNSISTISLMMAPLIGSFITYFFSWRSVFIVTLVISALGFIGVQIYGKVIPLQQNKISFSFSHVGRDIFSILRNKNYMFYGLSWSIICSVLFIYFAKLPFIGFENNSFIFNGVTQSLIMGIFVITSFLISKYMSQSNANLIKKVGMFLVVLSAGIILISSLYASFYLLYLGIAFFSVANACLIGILAAKSLEYLKNLKGTGAAALQAIRYFLITGALHITFFSNYFHNTVLIIVALASLAVLFYLLGENFERKFAAQERELIDSSSL